MQRKNVAQRKLTQSNKDSQPNKDQEKWGGDLETGKSENTK